MDLMKNYAKVKFNVTRNRPKMISWDITNRCNMNCKHCLNSSGDSNIHDYKNELNDEEQINLAYQIADLSPEQFCICGGETLLNKNIYKIIQIVSNRGIMVNMVSNGLLLSPDVAFKLKESGINNVQISVDGLGYQHDIFRNTPGAFRKAIEALKNLDNASIKKMVSFTPNKLDVPTFEIYIDYMYNTVGVDNFRMMPLLPIGRAATECANIFLNSTEYFNFINKITVLRNEYKNIDFEWGDPLEHLFLILFNKRKYPIVMGISSTGNLTITPYIPIMVGNIRKHSLKEYWTSGYNEIWGNKEIQDILRNIRNIYDLGKIINPVKKEIIENNE